MSDLVKQLAGAIEAAELPADIRGDNHPNTLNAMMNLAPSPP